MNALANIVIHGTRLNLHCFGLSTVTKVGTDHKTNELVAQVKPDKGPELYLSLSYCNKVRL